MRTLLLHIILILLFIDYSSSYLLASQCDAKLNIMETKRLADIAHLRTFLTLDNSFSDTAKATFHNELAEMAKNAAVTT